MTTLFEIAIETARTLPAEKQDEIARMVLMLAEKQDEVYLLSPEERAALTISLKEANDGVRATQAEVDAVWAKHSL